MTVSIRVLACCITLAGLAGRPAGAAEPPPAAAVQAEFDAAWAVLQQGDLSAGLPLMEAALRQGQQRLGERDLATLKIHDYLGGTLLRLGRLAEAKAAFELILRRHREAGSQASREYLSSLNNLANTVETLESPGAALPLFAEANELRNRQFGADDLESVTVLGDYASALGEVGQVHESLSLMERVVALRVQGQGERHPFTLTTLNNLGHTLSQLGRYAEALAVHERVLRLRLEASGERHPSTLVSMNNTALMLKYLGRYEEAQTLHQRAVELQTQTLGAQHFSTLTGRRGLAADLMALNRLDEALPALRELLADSQRAYPATHRHVLYTRVELALVLEKLGRPEEALAELEPAWSAYQQSLGPDHFSTLSAGAQRARLLRQLGRGGTSALLDELLTRVRAQYGADFPLGQTLAAELAGALAAEGELPAAERLLAGLVGEAEAVYQGLPVSANAERRQQNQQLGQSYRRRAQLLASMGRLDEAFVALERGKARGLLEQLAERELALAAGVSAPQWAQLQQARERVHLLTARLRDAPSPAARQLLLQQGQEADAQLSRLLADLRAQHPRYVRVSGLALARAGADAALLPAGALLVSYLVLDDGGLGAMTLDARGGLQWHALGGSRGLADAVESLRLWSGQAGRVLLDDGGRRVQIVHWREAGEPRWRVVPLELPVCVAAAAAGACRPQQARVVEAGAADAGYQALRQHLAQRLLEPMRARLQAHRRWLISPDGALGLLPFDVLPWRGQRSLGAQVALSQLQSLSVLKAGQGLAAEVPAALAKDGSLALLAMGNPAFGAGPTPAAGAQTLRRLAWRQAMPAQPGAPAGWPALPGSEAEMRRAAAQFGAQQTRVFSGQAATEARLRRLSASGELARARHLLFATHAWFDAARAEATGLVLGAEGAGEAEDGELSLGDIAGLQLRSRLVVLSACNTARADAGAAGAGQFGFAYALNLAGNRNALLTLWPVQDAATADFMARFFARVARGQAQAEALQATKRDFIRHAHRAWRAPRYWAGFTLFGL